MIAKGADVYFGSQDASVRSYRFAGTGWVAKPSFTAPVIGTVTTGLGFSTVDRIVGGAGLPVTGAGGVFSFLEADGSGLQKNPAHSLVRRLSETYPLVPTMSCFTGARQLVVS